MALVSLVHLPSNTSASPEGFRGHASAFLRVGSDHYGLKAPGSRAEPPSPGLLSSREVEGSRCVRSATAAAEALPSVAVLAQFPQNAKFRNGNERAAPRDTVRWQQVLGREGRGVRSSSSVVRSRDHHAERAGGVRSMKAPCTWLLELRISTPTLLSEY